MDKQFNKREVARVLKLILDDLWEQRAAGHLNDEEWFTCSSAVTNALHTIFRKINDGVIE